MAISGLVLTLGDDARGIEALERLARDPRLTLGDRFGSRLAVVAETNGIEADRDLWDDLRALPGVLSVELSFVQFDEESEEASEGQTSSPPASSADVPVPTAAAERRATQTEDPDDHR